MDNQINRSGNQTNQSEVEVVSYWVITMLDALLVVGVCDGLLLFITPELLDSMEIFLLIQLCFLVGALIGCILYNFTFVQDYTFEPLNYFFSALSSLAGLVILSSIVIGIIAVIFILFVVFVFIPFVALCIILIKR